MRDEGVGVWKRGLTASESNSDAIVEAKTTAKMATKTEELNAAPRWQTEWWRNKWDKFARTKD